MAEHPPIKIADDVWSTEDPTVRFIPLDCPQPVYFAWSPSFYGVISIPDNWESSCAASAELRMVRDFVE